MLPERITNLLKSVCGIFTSGDHFSLLRMEMRAGSQPGCLSFRKLFILG